jgi:IS5 family transposase
MLPKKQYEHPDLFRSRLDQILSQKHPLYRLANRINWSYFEKKSGPPMLTGLAVRGSPSA